MRYVTSRRLTLGRQLSLWNSLLPHLERLASLRIKLWVVELIQKDIESEFKMQKEA